MGRSINRLRNKKGFTLIELIVVLAVLAIIMAIAVPRFGGVREQAKVDADMATLASIAKLAEFEYVRQDLEAKAEGERVLANPSLEDLIKDNFADSATIFQSDNLKTYTINDIEFTDGKVTNIQINNLDYTCTGGKFTPPLEEETAA